MNGILKFEDLMRDYETVVFGAAVRLLGNEIDAQDIRQEVFLKAYQWIGVLQRSPASAGAWLMTVTRNLCLNHLSRYRARWCFFSEMLRDGEETLMGPDFAAPDNTRKRLDQTERRLLLEAALRQLPPSQRRPLLLYHFEDHSYAEITVKLGVSLAKLKMDLHRGRKALRNSLKLNPNEQLD